MADITTGDEQGNRTFKGAASVCALAKTGLRDDGTCQVRTISVFGVRERKMEATDKKLEPATPSFCCRVNDPTYSVKYDLLRVHFVIRFPVFQL